MSASSSYRAQAATAAEIQRRDEPSLAAAALLGHRDDFVIDLRVDGQVESYLRGLEPHGPRGSRLLRTTRRALDIATASVALLLAAPLMGIIAGALAISRNGTPVFSQERVGRHGRIFRCHKFRTMYPDADERLASLLNENPEFRAEWLRDQKVARDPRVTSIGRLLRKTSLDELPQLFDVLSGRMSIVGPRPVLPGETLRYGDAISTVLSVRPGITGLWQVSGRNALPYDERVRIDVEYAQKQSLRLDATILAKTVTAVTSGEGAS